jgi:hypothetical protein
MSKGLKAEFERILQNIRVHSAALSEIALAENMLNIDNIRRGGLSYVFFANVRQVYLQRTSSRKNIETVDTLP